MPAGPTPGDEPGDAVGRITTIGLENRAGGILVTWTEPSGNPTSYELQWEISGRTFLHPNTVIAGNTSYLIPANMLAEGDTYYARVRGVRGGQLGEFSIVADIRRLTP